MAAAAALLAAALAPTAAAAADPSAGGQTVTAKGAACAAWGENEWGVPEDSNRCAPVDGMDRPWCFLAATGGDSDSEQYWDYCNASRAGGRSRSRKGKKGAADKADGAAFEYCVVGAGPAGLQLGYYMQRDRRSYVILERSEVGAFFRTHPRHRQLISINKRNSGHEADEPQRSPEFRLRHDWNSLLTDDLGFLFTNYTDEYLPPADLLVQYLEDYASTFKINVRTNTNVTAVAKDGSSGFRVHTAPYTESSSSAAKQYTCSVVIAATGLSVPFVPNFVGVEHMERYDEMPVDPAGFEGQSVLVIGNGNAAFETASNLVGVANYIHVASKSEVKLTIQTHYVGDVRLTAAVGAVIEGYQLKSLNGLLERSFDKMEDLIYFSNDTQGRKIVKAYDDSPEAWRTLVYPMDRHYDRILLCTGWQFDNSLFTEATTPKMLGDRRAWDPTAEEYVTSLNLHAPKENAGTSAAPASNPAIKESTLQFLQHGKWSPSQVSLHRVAGGLLEVHVREGGENGLSAMQAQEAELNRQKEVALAAEDYERAITLRDQLTSVRSKIEQESDRPPLLQLGINDALLSVTLANATTLTDFAVVKTLAGAAFKRHAEGDFSVAAQYLVEVVCLLLRRANSEERAEKATQLRSQAQKYTAQCKSIWAEHTAGMSEWPSDKVDCESPLPP